jgi:outer membrane protein TolC
MRRATTILLALGLCAGARAAGQVSLRDLEQGIGAAPAVRLAEADRAAAEARRDVAQALAAPRLFGSVSASRFSDPFHIDEYSVQTGAPNEPPVEYLAGSGRPVTRYGATLGVRVPLFGTRALARREIEAADGEVQLQWVREELGRAEALAALRHAYIDAWTRARQVRLAQAWLGGEERAREVLRLRESAGLLLPAEAQALRANWLAVRRAESDAQLAGDDALRRLETLAGVPLEGKRLQAPLLAAGCITRAALERAAGNQPDIRLVAAQLEQKRRLLAASGAGLVEGGLSLSHGRVREAGGGAGRATTVALDFSMPLSADRWRRAQRASASAEVERAQLVLDARRAEYAAWTARLSGELEARQAAVQAGEQRLAAAREANREARERFASLDTEPVAALLRAQFEVYQAASALLDAQAALAHAQAGALGHGVTCPMGEAAPAGTQDEEAAGLLSQPLPLPAPGPGWYAWKGFRFYQAGPALFWAALPPASRLLVSLDGAELRAVQAGGEAARRLRALVSEAAVHGVRIELLLGDPDWALPEKAAALKQLVRALSPFGFHAIHLDLERMQLPPARRADWSAGIVAAVARLRAASPLPLALSLHPRDAAIDGLLAQLEAAGLSEATLMAYDADAARVAALVAPIMRAHPNLRFSVAQSIEPGVANRAPDAPTFDSLAARLAAFPNFAGIIVQSLEHRLAGASHEN